MGVEMDQEWQRLQGIYAAMSDVELLRLVGAKAGLTEVAQQAVDAEVRSRGLTVEAASVPELAPMPEVTDAEGDPSLAELMTFQIAMDAETALRALDDCGIPVKMEPAMRRLVEGGPLVKTNWLTLYVELTRLNEAQSVLRERMGLFPVLEADEVDDSGDDDGGGELPAIVGNFEGADAEIVRKTLTDAGIWFQGEAEEGVDGTMIEVRFEDWERALALVEAAFGEE